MPFGHRFQHVLKSDYDGRMATEEPTRERILGAARQLFGERGYRGTTIRAVAEQAGVDVALVPYYFHNKDGLFTASVELPIDPAAIVSEVFAAGLDAVGERLIRTLMDRVEDPVSGPPILVLLRGALTGSGQSDATFGEYIRAGLLRRYTEALGRPDGAKRASLAGAQMIGVLVARYLLRLEPLAGMSHDEVVAAVAPAVQRYLTGDLD